MSANKFATMLHRKTNKLTMILIYVVLEWTLILLLFLNSLFSYLIVKFAQYFGLKPPCSWCSRIDHVFEPGNNKNMHRDLLCEAHATEISKMRYCSNHQKLSESQDMCEDCLTFKPEFHQVSKSGTFYGMIQSDEEIKLAENCSCCGVTMLPHIVIKPSWDVLEYVKKGETIFSEADKNDRVEKIEDFDTDLHKVEDENSMVSESISKVDEVEKLDVIFEEDEEEEIVEEKQEIIMKDQAIQVCIIEDQAFHENPPQHLEYFIDYTSHQLVPVESIDSVINEDQKRDELQDSNSDSEAHEEAKTEVSIDEICRGVEEIAEPIIDMSEESQFGGFEHIKLEENENSLVFNTEKCSINVQVDVHTAEEDTARVSLNETEDVITEQSMDMNEESQLGGSELMEIEEDENFLVFNAKESSEREIIVSRDLKDVKEHEDVKEEEEEEKKSFEDHSANEDIAQLPLNEIGTEVEAEVIIGSEILNLDVTGEIQIQEDNSIDKESKDVQEPNTIEEKEKKHFDDNTVDEVITQTPLNEVETEVEPEVTIGTEIFDLDVTGEIQTQENYSIDKESKDVQEPKIVEEEEKKLFDDHPVCEDIAQTPLNEIKTEISIGAEVHEIRTHEDRSIDKDSEDVQEPETIDVEKKIAFDVHLVDENIAQTPLDETESEVLIGTEIPVLDIKDEAQRLEAQFSYERTQADSENIQEPKDDNEEEKKPSDDNNPACEDIPIGTEISDLDITNEVQSQEPHSSNEYTQEDLSISSINEDNDQGVIQVEGYKIKTSTLSIEVNNHLNNQLSICSETEGEDKFPDTPTSLDSVNHLHKKLLLLEKKDYGTEDSLDGGSVTSELESGDTIITSEGLKTALKAERKALHVLYTELEEERSASAIAANQTMAMINRLQEEKAAMQMEALHYQRMMEEQAEYDQEALQLLNELMVKREKEKEELERELEMYRYKVFEHESRMLRNQESDSENRSLDLNEEAREDYLEFDNENVNTPVNGVLNLEGSLMADFEEERVSILEQLKFLEEKMITIDHEDENGHGRKMTRKGKNLLPLFDATSDENGDIENENEMKNIGVEDELEHVYERLQALESDREFLKNCISSLNKGDKGMYLLHEILQHLKDLRNVDLRVKNFSDHDVLT